MALDTGGQDASARLVPCGRILIPPPERFYPGNSFRVSRQVAPSASFRAVFGGGPRTILPAPLPPLTAYELLQPSYDREVAALLPGDRTVPSWVLRGALRLAREGSPMFRDDGTLSLFWLSAGKTAGFWKVPEGALWRLYLWGRDDRDCGPFNPGHRFFVPPA